MPRELRHTFVSLSAHSLPEATALLAGHTQTATTELVYRHQIVPGPDARRRTYGSDLWLADGALGLLPPVSISSCLPW